MSVMDNMLLRQPLVFVDIETNGLDHVRGRVIEIAAIRVENGQVTQTFQSLIDPETELPQFITNLTGITTHDLQSAPTFRQIGDELESILAGALFVAHNVRFDYSFIKQEFKRLGRPFAPKQLCTVRLSRVLYPHYKSHKLQSLIERHGFTYAARHRAYDDAAILWQFVQYVSKHFPPEQVDQAIQKQIKTPSVPRNLEPDIVRNLPEQPGVYIFEDESGQALYVGKSVNIKKRVMSHFSQDHSESKEFKIAQHIRNIATHVTSGELSALLLESKLVKDLQPVYNRRLRRLQRLLLVTYTLDDNGYMNLVYEEATDIQPSDTARILAVYPRRGRAKEAVLATAKTFYLCPKLLGLEKSGGACFSYQLHKCKGACVGKESSASYNARLLGAFTNQRIQTWPYGGPILIEEQHSQGDRSSFGLIVDKWCVLGEVQQEAYCDPVVRQMHGVFDLDTYKILESQLRLKSKSLAVRQLGERYG